MHPNAWCRLLAWDSLRTSLFDASFPVHRAVLFRKNGSAVAVESAALAAGILGVRQELAGRSAEQARDAGELRERLAVEIPKLRQELAGQSAEQAREAGELREGLAAGILMLRQELSERSAEEARELCNLREELAEVSTAIRERLELDRQALGMAVARQHDALEEVLHSRIWRTLCAAGAVILNAARAGRHALAAARRILKVGSRDQVRY